MPFACSICGEESTQICARCTKDSCDNHLCAKCRRCSDCCECEVALDEPMHETTRPVVRPAAVTPESPEPKPEPVREPEPDPDPEPEREPDVDPLPELDPPAEEVPPVHEPEPEPI